MTCSVPVATSHRTPSQAARRSRGVSSSAALSALSATAAAAASSVAQGAARLVLAQHHPSPTATSVAPAPTRPEVSPSDTLSTSPTPASTPAASETPHRDAHGQRHSGTDERHTDTEHHACEPDSDSDDPDPHDPDPDPHSVDSPARPRPTPPPGTSGSTGPLSGPMRRDSLPAGATSRARSLRAPIIRTDDYPSSEESRVVLVTGRVGRAAIMSVTRTQGSAEPVSCR